MKIDKSQEFNERITKSSIVRALERNVNYLRTHNKNLTKEQWCAICELNAIIYAIKEQQEVRDESSIYECEIRKRERVKKLP